MSLVEGFVGRGGGGTVGGHGGDGKGKEGREHYAGRNRPRSESRSNSPVLKGLALTDFSRCAAEDAVGKCSPATAAARGRRRSSIAAKDLLKAADLTSGGKGGSREGVQDDIRPEGSLTDKAGWASKREDKGKGKAGTSKAEEIARAKEENAARLRVGSFPLPSSPLLSPSLLSPSITSPPLPFPLFASHLP